MVFILSVVDVLGLKGLGTHAACGFAGGACFATMPASCNRRRPPPPLDCRHGQQPSFSSGLSMSSTKAGSERAQFRAGHLACHPPCTVYELLAPAWKNITASCTWIVLAASGARYLAPSPPITWPWGLITFSEGSSPYSGLRTYQQQQQQPPPRPYCLKDARRKIIQ